MEIYQLEFLISRIKAGYLRYKADGDIILIKPPTRDIEYEANEIYIDIYNQAMENDLLSDEDAKNHLIRMGEWSDKKQDELDNILPKHIDYWKIEIYNSYFKSRTKETLRKYLKTAQNELSSLLNKRHQLDCYTCNGIALYAKNVFIFTNSCFINNECIDFSKHNITKLMNYYHANSLSSNTIREIARSGLWNNIWSAYKKSGVKIFVNDVLTMEQMALSQWSSLYDSIQESPECPPDDVLKDDDAVDGWLLIQQKKRESNKAQSVFENTKSTGNSNIDNAQEVFMVAETKEDIEKIRNLNDSRGLGVINSRLKKIAEKGIVKDIEFTDVQNELMMEANRAATTQMRNRRG